MDSVQALLLQAKQDFDAGRNESAAGAAAKVLALAPDSLDAYRILGYCHRRMNNPQAALAAFERAVALAPEMASLHLEIGHIQQALGRIPEAADAYGRCSALSPGDGYSRELYTQTLMEEWLFAMSGRKIGREASKSYASKLQSGFFRTYLSGANVLDIGYRGGYGDASPILAHATGIDLGYPGYDGINLPFAAESQDAVYSSHCLEHMDDLTQVLREWFRVLKIGGYLVAAVPHQHLYEKRSRPPSAWNASHRHFFTPATLLAEIEAALPPNHYRVRHLADNDFLFDYSLPPTTHSVGCYEIELVVQKIAPPAWTLA